MTWKAYATVSGATMLAGWLASAPPSSVPGRAVLDSRAAGSGETIQTIPGRVTPSPDIEREAMRQKARVRREVAYTQPQRNPFRFGAASSIESLTADPVEGASLVETPVPAVPSPSPISLAGIAEDKVDQRVERTAILSSTSGILLVHEGEDVLGQYRVAKIESEAVELVSYADGTTLHLGFNITP